MYETDNGVTQMKQLKLDCNKLIKTVHSAEYSQNKMERFMTLIFFFYLKLWTSSQKKSTELCPANMEEQDWHAVHIFSLMVSEGIGSYLMF